MEQDMIKLLVVIGEEHSRLNIKTEMARKGHDVETASDGEVAWQAMQDRDFQVVLCDIDLSRLGGIELVRRINTELPNPPEVIIHTVREHIDTAIDAMGIGAYDFVIKPCRLAELGALVEKAADKFRLNKDNQILRAQIERTNPVAPEIIAASPQMKEVLRLAKRVAGSDASVLITGESGTGKELIAQAIHRLSARNANNFVDLNCAALQENLLESELFGHEAGAFSGAKGRKLGLFEIADSGTLFLDEIMEMPSPLQSKVLRALETRSFFRVGGVKKVDVDVRLIAATNRNPDAAISSGDFRSDLFYRINSFEINIPPLRERSEDIKPLTRHILGRIAGVNAPEVSPSAMDALVSYSWPGNVRQLRNALERAVIMCDNGRIESKDLPTEVLAGNREPQGSFVSFPDSSTSGVPINLRQTERQQIINALKQTGWHRGKTAELLGISPSTLYRRLRGYELEVR